MTAIRSPAMPESCLADRLDARLSRPVGRRLRMLALVNGEPVSHVLDRVLDTALPQAGELAALLTEAAS